MRFVLALLVLSAPALAESYVALRTIPARTVLLASDITGVQADIAGAVSDPQSIIGREARITVFAGHPILAEDFVSPALIDRNQIVSLIYSDGGLQIGTEGRALDRGGAGTVIRVMNLASRTIVSGVVSDMGEVRIGTGMQGE
jgi:flagellar basal body P-ring formation protein FlgA